MFAKYYLESGTTFAAGKDELKEDLLRFLCVKQNKIALIVIC